MSQSTVILASFQPLGIIMQLLKLVKFVTKAIVSSLALAWAVWVLTLKKNL